MLPSLCEVAQSLQGQVVGTTIINISLFVITTTIIHRSQTFDSSAIIIITLDTR